MTAEISVLKSKLNEKNKKYDSLKNDYDVVAKRCQQ